MWPLYFVTATAAYPCDRLPAECLGQVGAPVVDNVRPHVGPSELHASRPFSDQAPASIAILEDDPARMVRRGGCGIPEIP